VVMGWSKGIWVETTANATWQRLRHSFWSFEAGAALPRLPPAQPC
jgi:hypothetical protein